MSFFLKILYSVELRYRCIKNTIRRTPIPTLKGGAAMSTDAADTTPMLMSQMLAEAWEYLQEAKQAEAHADVAVWLEAIDVLLDSPQVIRKPL